MASRAPKRRAIRRGSSSQSQQPSYDSNLFRSLGCENFFESIEENPHFVKERAINLAPGDFDEMQQMINNRGWNHLVTYPKRASKALVYEFFSNIFPKPAVDGSLIFPSRTSYVRGRIIPYEADIINELFGIRPVEVLASRLRVKVSRQRIKNNPELAAEISAALCKPGMDWVRNKHGDPWKIMTNTLTPVARGWAAFILTTICPSSNISELNIERASLTASIMRGEPVNIGWELENEISNFANFKDGAQPSYWRHARLVALLCERAGIVAEADEETIAPSAPITGSWIRTVAGGVHFEQPAPREAPPEEQGQYPQEQEHQEEEPTFYREAGVDSYAEDFQHLQARMDLMAENQERLERGIAVNQERTERGMLNLFRAMSMMQRGEQFDPTADIFQEPPPDFGRG